MSIKSSSKTKNHKNQTATTISMVILKIKAIILSYKKKQLIKSQMKYVSKITEIFKINDD